MNSDTMQIDTRKVIQEGEGSKATYYIPGFLRVKVKNFTEMNLENLDAQMNAAIIFTVYYGSLPEELAQKLES
jgi:hypothetical protein